MDEQQGEHMKERMDRKRNLVRWLHDLKTIQLITTFKLDEQRLWFDVIMIMMIPRFLTS